MNEQVIIPVAKQKLKGIELVKALLERQRLIGNHLANGGTVSELETMGYKFGTIDLSNIKNGKSERI